MSDKVSDDRRRELLAMSQGGRAALEHGVPARDGGGDSGAAEFANDFHDAHGKFTFASAVKALNDAATHPELMDNMHGIKTAIDKMAKTIKPAEAKEAAKGLGITSAVTLASKDKAVTAIKSRISGLQGSYLRSTSTGALGGKGSMGGDFAKKEKADRESMPHIAAALPLARRVIAAANGESAKPDAGDQKRNEEAAHEVAKAVLEAQKTHGANYNPQAAGLPSHDESRKLYQAVRDTLPGDVLHSHMQRHWEHEAEAKSELQAKQKAGQLPKVEPAQAERELRADMDVAGMMSGRKPQGISYEQALEHRGVLQQKLDDMNSGKRLGAKPQDHAITSDNPKATQRHIDFLDNYMKDKGPTQPAPSPSPKSKGELEIARDMGAQGYPAGTIARVQGYHREGKLDDAHRLAETGIAARAKTRGGYFGGLNTPRYPVGEHEAKAAREVLVASGHLNESPGDKDRRKKNMDVLAKHTLDVQTNNAAAVNAANTVSPHSAGQITRSAEKDLPKHKAALLAAMVDLQKHGGTHNHPEPPQAQVFDQLKKSHDTIDAYIKAKKAGGAKFSDEDDDDDGSTPNTPSDTPTPERIADLMKRTALGAKALANANKE